MSLDELSLAHTMWNCKYHIVFAPKYRRQVFFGEKRMEIGKILRKLCDFKQVSIVEAEVCPDHIHMLVEIPPKMSVSGFVGYLKGKSSLIIYQRWGNLKYKYRNREFWCRGYYGVLVNLLVNIKPKNKKEPPQDGESKATEQEPSTNETLDK